MTLRQKLIDRLRVRHQTYRKRDAARRSFYKFVCKEGFYGTAYIGKDIYGTFISRTAPKWSFGYCWRRGYPAWEASRSEVRDRWEKIFEKHRQKWIEEDVAEMREELSAQDRVRLVSDKRNIRFFRFLGAGVLLSK